ncbi:unnamed protein product [Meganyctiphanes norvegica]|uniref:ETS domain-containing protein n=1 Tax=Meganyctiphanes norvegica TaxID=48144 RepID=A0AAV2QL85_MEGNR
MEFVTLQMRYPDIDTRDRHIPSMAYSSTDYIDEGLKITRTTRDIDTRDRHIPSMAYSSTDYIDEGLKITRTTSEFQLDINLEYFEAESEAMLDSHDPTWDFPGDVPFSPAEVPFSAACVDDILRKTPGSASRDRCPWSWEFLMRLLVSPETNPSLIRWQDEDQYIFKLLQPDLIVQIWNAKSEKASLNKANFARSLRYHYKKGILLPVRDKQLVYRCGPKAIEYIKKLRGLDS